MKFLCDKDSNCKVIFRYLNKLKFHLRVISKYLSGIFHIYLFVIAAILTKIFMTSKMMVGYNLKFSVGAFLSLVN